MMAIRVFVAIFLVSTLIGGGGLVIADAPDKAESAASAGQSKWVAVKPPAGVQPKEAPKDASDMDHEPAASDLRRFLPPAQEGWTRFDWNDFADQELTRAGRRAVQGSASAGAGRYLTSDEAMDRAFWAQGTWVYAGFGKVLSIRAVHSGREYKGGGLRDPNALNEDMDSKNQLFTEIKGVRFYETTDKAWQGQKAPYGFYKAWLGNGVTLTVRARADDGTVRGYLRQIDYGGILAERAGKAPKTAGIPLWTILFGGRDTRPVAPEPQKPQVKINRGLPSE